MSNWHYGIPKRENELRAAVHSPVITSQLSPAELEDIRQKYPATKADKAFKKPIEIKTRPKGDKDMAKAKFNLTEDQFNAERASGKSIALIAKEQGVTEATVYNHVSKWAHARKPGQEKLLREKDVSPAADPKAELLDKAEKEIERLTVKNQRLDQRMVTAQNEATKAWAEVEQLRDKNDQYAALCRELEDDKNEYKRMFESGYKLGQDQIAKISEHLETINSLRENSDSLIAENNRLTDRIVELEELQKPVNEVPDKEVQRLDSAIQDLTRARWILNRLSASGNSL
ncbi:hypothetical protein P9222_33185 (plasmid) [Paenibacillus amylolyticus]|nr:hypothetical protein [Paenibacillus amylolyticus]WFR65735.1 hypothetical protein P9222_33185 [Paenibacillus amylolyticus]